MGWNLFLLIRTHAYLLKEMKKYLILLDGPKGSGKSNLSELLEKKLSNTEFFGIDKERNF